ncbi:MAG: YicC family protein [Fuerstiella sp.]|nr:YicC family protein [Fuerstiella sp.]MCP4859043.1 YicC family protein [Fuerstiella sp.]
MLLSMTGFGNAIRQSETAYVSIELKAVNNRYLKVSMRLPDVVARFESDIENLVRRNIARGAIQLSFRVRLTSQSSGFSIDRSVLDSYLRQLAEVTNELPAEEASPVALSDLLQLPGVVSESELSAESVESVWPTLEAALRETLEHFHDFRRTEGESMLQDLKLQCSSIEQQVDEVEKFAPIVVSEYREKLLERVRKAIQDTDVPLEDKDVIREVALFADRCDINEEITRLRSHIQQFHRFLDDEKSLGRKLEFLGQEMFREINTIGSKANNVTIAHSVVEMKAAIERIREVLQNVE